MFTFKERKTPSCEPVSRAARQAVPSAAGPACPPPQPAAALPSARPRPHFWRHLGPRGLLTGPRPGCPARRFPDVAREVGKASSRRTRPCRRQGFAPRPRGAQTSAPEAPSDAGWDRWAPSGHALCRTGGGRPHGAAGSAPGLFARSHRGRRDDLGTPQKAGDPRELRGFTAAESPGTRPSSQRGQCVASRPAPHTVSLLRGAGPCPPQAPELRRPSRPSLCCPPRHGHPLWEPSGVHWAGGEHFLLCGTHSSTSEHFGSRLNPGRAVPLTPPRWASPLIERGPEDLAPQLEPQPDDGQARGGATWDSRARREQGGPRPLGALVAVSGPQPL